MRARLRDLGITIGEYPTGKHNAITDVPGVLVGHTTLIHNDPTAVRTGVTVILPRDGEVLKNRAFAGFHSFNGNGELTGSHWIQESGLLSSAIALTNTHQVGIVRDALVSYERAYYVRRAWLLPVVAETFDGWLNNADAMAIRESHVHEALRMANGGAVHEGSVGGGTGMICHEFKGGIGTASRRVKAAGEVYTLGALVQTNYGHRRLLRVDGVPVGQRITSEFVPTPWGDQKPVFDGSIIVILATDAPLIPAQCKRLAQRATVGLARVGGTGDNSSGDIFLAFATGNNIPAGAKHPVDIQMLPHAHLDPLFRAAAEATEEAILNALTAADTMTGYKNRTAHALPLDVLQEVMKAYM